MNGQLIHKSIDPMFEHPVMTPKMQEGLPTSTAMSSDFLPPAQSNSRLEQLVTSLLLELGVDVQQEHFHETPRRVAKSYRDLTRGYRTNPAEILKTFSSDHNELVVISNIAFQSLCPHHMLIYRGRMDLGYVPNGKIVGLSKIPRLIQAMAARLIVQEELVAEIADTFMQQVKPLGCVVRATGKHDCVAVRGVRASEASMTTIVPRGVFKESSRLMDEFHRALGTGGR